MSFDLNPRDEEQPTKEEWLEAENFRLREKLESLPADWSKDSSLKTWFPFTAEELLRIKTECELLKVRLEQSKKLYELTLSNEIIWMKKYSEIEKKLAEMRSVLRNSLAIPRAWMGGHITFKQWDEACKKVFSAIDDPGVP